jgi:flavin-dependent dehydrogenase
MKPITIIGGGLAGLTLGVLLRREDVAVAVIEAGKYPRHRVCGEFICGRGLEIFRGLGLGRGKGVRASTCSFHLKNRRAVRLKLEPAALCISRSELDGLLAVEFARAGGILKLGERANVDANREGVVRATGRRRSESGGGHLFGLKAHAIGAALSSDLELHFGGENYVGICKVDDQRANVCGLFYSRGSMRSLREDWQARLAGSIWSDAVEGVCWDEGSFSSVAGLTMDRHAPELQFSIGDAAAMIPPLTGNGMSMAFESAVLACGPLLEFSAGRISWAECLRWHSTAWNEAFSSRLQWAGFVQPLLFSGAGQQFLYVCTRLFPSLPTFFFARTR